MNKQCMDILNILRSRKYINQRDLAENSGHSLGVVNRSLKELVNYGYINSKFKLTDKAEKAFQDAKPKNAVILAAGFGMRMVPINMETPKGLLKVNGEPLIERTIKQLNEAGIREIYVVVGFMKEQYEYLMNYFRCGYFNAEIDINFPPHGRLSPRRISVAVHKCAKNAH